MTTKYSTKAIKALAFLFRRYNDIDIYVEDKGSHNMYEVLFNRMLDDRAKVSKIFQLGGREAVLSYCKNDQLDATRKRIYIIDGDCDFLLGIDPPNLKHFHRLNVYTSENLLVSKNSLLEVAVEQLSNEAKASIETRFDFDKILSGFCNKLLPLFIMYVVVYKLQLDSGIHIHIKTIDYSVKQLCLTTADTFDLSESKINNRICEIKDELINGYGFNKDLVQSYMEDITKIILAKTCPVQILISAKSYTLPFLLVRLKRSLELSTTLEQLKVRLARYCELDIDSELKDKIINCSLGI